jgi:uncharacterized protein YbaR (Trm112 family)
VKGYKWGLACCPECKANLQTIHSGSVGHQRCDGFGWCPKCGEVYRVQVEVLSNKRVSCNVSSGKDKRRDVTKP